MLTKTAMALAAAAIFGAVSAAQANNNADNWNEVGGFHIGPLGQRMGGTGSGRIGEATGAHFSGSPIQIVAASRRRRDSTLFSDRKETPWIARHI